MAAPAPDLTAKAGSKPRRARRTETMVLFAVANQMFAIAADAVQEIRSTDSLAGSAIEMDQMEISKVRHTVARGRRTYFVVNAGMHFGLPVSRPMLILILRNLPVAVLIDRIERMAEISVIYALPLAFAGDERRWYRGLTEVDDAVIPVIRPDGFLTEDEFRSLDMAVQGASSRQDAEGAAQA